MTHHTRSRRRLRGGLAAGAVLLTMLSACARTTDSSPGGAATAGGGEAAPKDITIALSNSFLGNTWRQTMVKIFEKTAQDAKTKGLIKDFSVNNTSQNTPTEQIAQIKALILNKPSAILINSASPTALNPVITEACNAGIVVITFDSVGTADCAYKEQADLAQFGALGAKGVIDGLGGKGNVIVVRGVTGSAPEKIIYDAQMAEVKKSPDIKVVTELQGEASNPVTQQAVQAALPSLPQIEGVITGGSTFGALQAFASANRPVPLGNFSNDGVELALWKQLKDKDPNFKSSSVRPDPGQSALSFWLALEILKGTNVPKDLTSPNLVITNDNFDKWLAVTPESATAAWQWTQEEALAGLKAQQEGKPMPEPQIPSSAP